MNVDLLQHVQLTSGDVFRVSTATSHGLQLTQVPEDETSCFPAFKNRLKIMQDNRAALGSDELQFFSSILKPFAGNCIIHDPLIVSFDLLPDTRRDLERIVARTVQLQSKAWVPIWHKKHWSVFEIEWFPLNKTLNVNAINMNEAVRTTLVHTIQHACRTMNCEVRCVEHIVPTGHGWCGWAILYRCAMTFLAIPADSIQAQINRFQDRASNKIDDPWLLAKARALASESLGASSNDVPSLHANLGIPEFARCVRSLFAVVGVAELLLQNEERFFGNTGNEDTEMPQQEIKKDPLQQNDPWSRRPKKNARWEDLVLPDQHCFMTEKGDRLPQVHRHQLNSNVAGVAFCTKASLPEILARNPRSPFALLLPANDRLKIDANLGVSLSLSVETIVHDKEAEMTYKRQVVIAQKAKEVIFKLPEAVYKATLTEHKELVFEVHSNLMSAEAFQSFREKPAEMFRHKANEQFPQ